MPFHRFENRERKNLTPDDVAQTLRGTPYPAAKINGKSVVECGQSRLYRLYSSAN